MSRILVTGATGFIGRWVVAGLIARGHEVVAYDLKPNGNALDDAAPGLSDRVTLVRGDISDGSVREAAKGCDGIAHLAGVLTPASAADPVRGAMINVIGALHVFEAARAEDIRRIAYASSAAVFGRDDPIHPRPMTQYGAAKLAIEGAARAYLGDHGIPSIGFRPYIVYGPGISSGIAAGPSIAIAAARQGRSSTIHFSGAVGFVHAFDVADLIVTSVLSDMDGAEAYTLCGETADVTAFRDAVQRRFPKAEIAIDGPALPIPGDLATSPLPARLSALPVTGIEHGIDLSLAHYDRRDRP